MGFLSFFIYADKTNNYFWPTKCLRLAGLYPLQQAICMFYLKSTLDPLSLVSNLDAVILVSRNQVINEQFLEEAKESNDY